MTTLIIKQFGISIYYEESNKAEAKLVSTMKKDQETECEAFNLAVDSIETMILAHFSCGIDVSSDIYLKGISDAYAAVRFSIDAVSLEVIRVAEAHSKGPDCNESKITVTKSRTVDSVVDEEVVYEVSLSDWTTALADNDDNDDALLELMRTGKAERVSYDTTVVSMDGEESGREVNVNC